jgi:prepilin-type N-terminal cleavage/methylation domain-containing protein
MTMPPRTTRQYGFTIVELLVVIAIFGIFMGAVYTVYINHYKTAFSREEVLDVQQNVRIGMDRMARDLRMAGFLFPAPVEQAFSNISTIKIQTASSESTFGAINNVIRDDKFAITPAAVLSNFTPGVDTIGIFRPSIRTQIKNGAISTFSVLSSSSSSGRMTISPATAAESLRVGDMVCKNPNRILYIVDRTDTSQGCDKSPCLKRNAEVIAQGISNIRFAYFFDGANSVPQTDLSASTVDVSKITAIRVTVTGKTVNKTGSTDSQKTRELVSLIKLRNYK